MVNMTLRDQVVPGSSKRGDFTLVGRKTALLVIDMQQFLCEPSTPEEEQSYLFQTALPPALDQIQILVDAFRTARDGGCDDPHQSTTNTNTGYEVIFVYLQSATLDGRDISLDYKLSGPKLTHHIPRSTSRLEDIFGPSLVQPQPTIGKGDLLVAKTSSSVFCSTNLDYVLRNLGMEQVVVVGQYTDQCVESAVRDAANLGYLVTLAHDACVATSPENQAKGLHGAQGLARIVTTQQVVEEIQAEQEQLQQQQQQAANNTNNTTALTTALSATTNGVETVALTDAQVVAYLEARGLDNAVYELERHLHTTQQDEPQPPSTNRPTESLTTNPAFGDTIQDHNRIASDGESSQNGGATIMVEQRHTMSSSNTNSPIGGMEDIIEGNEEEEEEEDDTNASHSVVEDGKIEAHEKSSMNGSATLHSIDTTDKTVTRYNSDESSEEEDDDDDDDEEADGRDDSKSSDCVTERQNGRVIPTTEAANGEQGDNIAPIDSQSVDESSSQDKDHFQDTRKSPIEMEEPENDGELPKETMDATVAFTDSNAGMDTQQDGPENVVVPVDEPDETVPQPSMDENTGDASNPAPAVDQDDNPKDGDHQDHNAAAFASFGDSFQDSPEPSVMIEKTEEAKEESIRVNAGGNAEGDDTDERAVLTGDIVENEAGMNGKEPEKMEETEVLRPQSDNNEEMAMDETFENDTVDQNDEVDAENEVKKHVTSEDIETASTELQTLESENGASVNNGDSSAGEDEVPESMVGIDPSGHPPGTGLFSGVSSAPDPPTDRTIESEKLDEASSKTSEPGGFDADELSKQEKDKVDVGSNAENLVAENAKSFAEKKGFDTAFGFFETPTTDEVKEGPEKSVASESEEAMEKSGDDGNDDDGRDVAVVESVAFEAGWSAFPDAEPTQSQQSKKGNDTAILEDGEKETSANAESAENAFSSNDGWPASTEAGNPLTESGHEHQKQNETKGETDEGTVDDFDRNDESADAVTTDKDSAEETVDVVAEGSEGKQSEKKRNGFFGLFGRGRNKRNESVTSSTDDNEAREDGKTQSTSDDANDETTEVPVQQQKKSRGLFRRSTTSEEPSRKQIQVDALEKDKSDKQPHSGDELKVTNADLRQETEERGEVQMTKDEGTRKKKPKRRSLASSTLNRDTESAIKKKTPKRKSISGVIIPRDTEAGGEKKKHTKRRSSTGSSSKLKDQSGDGSSRSKHRSAEVGEQTPKAKSKKDKVENVENHLKMSPRFTMEIGRTGSPKRSRVKKSSADKTDENTGISKISLDSNNESSEEFGVLVEGEVKRAKKKSSQDKLHHSADMEKRKSKKSSIQERLNRSAEFEKKRSKAKKADKSPRSSPKQSPGSSKRKIKKGYKHDNGEGTTGGEERKKSGKKKDGKKKATEGGPPKLKKSLDAMED